MSNFLPVSNAWNVRSDDQVKWTSGSTVVLTEYLDFECEACKANYPILKQLYQEFSWDIQIVVRYFPLPWHSNSSTAAYAAQAASKQGKFWEMHDLLFETQSLWWEKRQVNQEQFVSYAQKIWLDIEQFKSDVASQAVQDRVSRDKNEWTKLWITGTPAFFLNGQRIQNPRTIEEFRTLIKAEILKNPKQPRGKKVHEHADFKLFINNTEFSLSGDQYQSTTGNNLGEEQHLHDNNGWNIHKHLTTRTITDFLASLNITLTSECIILNDGQTYCNKEDKTLKFFVNGKSITDFITYEFNDLDRILISYGAETKEQIKIQLDSVTDLSCMYSATCPERGKPPTETCVVGMWWEC